MQVRRSVGHRPSASLMRAYDEENDVGLEDVTSSEEDDSEAEATRTKRQSIPRTSVVGIGGGGSNRNSTIGGGGSNRNSIISARNSAINGR